MTLPATGIGSSTFRRISARPILSPSISPRARSITPAALARLLDHVFAIRLLRPDRRDKPGPRACGLDLPARLLEQRAASARSRRAPSIAS